MNYTDTKVVSTWSHKTSSWLLSIISDIDSTQPPQAQKLPPEWPTPWLEWAGNMCHLLHRPRNSVQYIYMYCHHNNSKKSGTSIYIWCPSALQCVTQPLLILHLISAGSSADFICYNMIHSKCECELYTLFNPPWPSHTSPSIPPPSKKKITSTLFPCTHEN